MLPARRARELLAEGAVPQAPFQLELLNVDLSDSSGPSEFFIGIIWEGKRQVFAASFKAVATPKKIQAAISEARILAARSGTRLPLVIAPHISEDTLAMLQIEGMSGLDLSGNFFITVPGQWSLFRTGQPNRYPSSQPIKKVYSGKSSLVGRVLLKKPQYRTVTDVRNEIVRLGIGISLATVSKVLTAMQEDLIVSKDDGIRLVRADQLLDRLASQYTGPDVRRRLVGNPDRKSGFLRQLVSKANQEGVQVAGRSEAHYVIAPASKERTVVYISRFGPWLDAIPFETTNRFPSVEMAEPQDESVFFDTLEEGGFRWCSKLQIYLELMHGGMRERKSADQLRDDLLGPARRLQS